MANNKNVTSGDNHDNHDNHMSPEEWEKTKKIHTAIQESKAGKLSSMYESTIEEDSVTSGKLNNLKFDVFPKECEIEDPVGKNLNIAGTEYVVIKAHEFVKDDKEVNSGKGKD